MSWIYRHAIRPKLFRTDSEEIHNQTLQWLGCAARHELACNALQAFLAPAPLPISLWNLTFPNPVGLAAGMDKYAAALPAWVAMGFGFCELGGITWHPQPGNPAPRIFRAIEDGALVNRMGFNNLGAEAMAAKLAEWRTLRRWPNHPVGINLGKSKITPLDAAAADYAQSLKTLWPYGDFFVINVSSPNTPQLRELQDRKPLEEVLIAAQEVNQSMAATVRRSPKPLLVKIAPDLAYTALDEVLELISSRNLDGIVATNTTTARPESRNAELRRVYSETGGLSGRPLKKRSTDVVRHIHRQSRGKVPIIGVGGIFNAEDAWEKITAGASLIQVYTGLVYEGPGLTKQIVEGLRQKLAQAGLSDLSQAIGVAAATNP